MKIDNNRVGSDQISKDRQKQTAEVFTPLELVHEMNNRIPNKMWICPDKTFCDPAAGDGNILVAIYEEKLFQGHDPVHALLTVFGVDIMEDNINSCRNRLFMLALEAGVESNKDLKRVSKILHRNIVWANSLEYDFRFRWNDNREETNRLSNEDIE